VQDYHNMGDMYRFNQDSRFEIRDLRVCFAHRDLRKKNLFQEWLVNEILKLFLKSNHRGGLKTLEDALSTLSIEFGVRHCDSSGVSYFSKTEAQGHTDSRDGTSSYRGKKHNSPRNHVESLLMLFQKAYAKNKGTSKVEKIIVTNEMGRLSQEEIKRMVRKAEKSLQSGGHGGGDDSTDDDDEHGEL
ncbi:luminal binding protein 5-like protein, partial [Tanacetum coccineum]